MNIKNEIKSITKELNLSKKEFVCLLSELSNKCNKENNYVCNIEKR